jgi:ABC-type transporter Mla subunit MlaD
MQGDKIMATELKERITADLEKAKQEGSLRSDRIREIVKSAVIQAMGELKEGSGEIRTIAKDAITAVIGLVKERGQAAKAEMMATVEGVVDGIRESRQPAIAHTQSQMDQLQMQLNTQTQQLEADVDGALVAIATEASQSSADVKTILEKIVSTVRESKQFATLQEQYTRLRSQLVGLDERLAEKYGDRYAQIKHQLEKYWDNTKTWYEENRTEVEAGKSDPVAKAQDGLGEKFAQAGSFVAQKEREIKSKIKDALHSETP